MEQEYRVYICLHNFKNLYGYLVFIYMQYGAHYQIETVESLWGHSYLWKVIQKFGPLFHVQGVKPLQQISITLFQAIKSNIKPVMTTNCFVLFL